MPRRTRYPIFKRIALQETSNWSISLDTASRYASTISKFLDTLDLLNGIDSVVDLHFVRDYVKARLEADDITEGTTLGEFSVLVRFLLKAKDMKVNYIHELKLLFMQDFKNLKIRFPVLKASTINMNRSLGLDRVDRAFLFYFVLRGARMKQVRTGVSVSEYYEQKIGNVDVVFMTFTHLKEKISFTEGFKKVLVCTCDIIDTDLCVVHNGVHEICSFVGDSPSGRFEDDSLVKINRKLERIKVIFKSYF